MDTTDLLYRDTKIEIKTSGYTQAWKQQKPTVISFDIAPNSYTWEPGNSSVVPLPKPTRLSYLFVFCVHTLLPHSAEAAASILHAIGIPNWRFCVAHTSLIDHLFGAQKRVSLSILEPILSKHGCQFTAYNKLKRTIDLSINSMRNGVADDKTAYSPPRPA